MKSKPIQLDHAEVLVPDYYQQVDSLPEDPVGSVPLMTQSENAMCFVMLQEIAPNDAMPFDDPQNVIDGIHVCLAEDQGLIEVDAGGSPGSRWIYSIVKTLKGGETLEGVQYVLTLDLEENGQVIHAQGFFDEAGATGLRDTMVFQMFASENGLEETKAVWMEDPYDPEYQQGILMNKSELKKFDEMFPAHPLSMAREFASVITGDM